MRDKGYIKLWRKTLDSGIMSHPTAWQVFGWVLLNVAWKRTRYPTRYGIIDLAPGQVATGRKKMAQELDSTERKIRTALDLLAKCEILTIKTTKTHSVITLVNWAKYQSDDAETTNSRPTGDQRATTVKEVKKERKTYSEDFENFWTLYPRRTGKAAAWKAWLREKPDPHAIRAALGWQKGSDAHLKREDRFIPHPATWLNGRRWEDEGGVKVCDHSKVEALDATTGKVRCMMCGSVFFRGE